MSALPGRPDVILNREDGAQDDVNPLQLIPMAIILSHPLTVQEIRVLQEFRRLATGSMSLAAIKALKHPAGGGDAPALSLAAKGYLAADTAGENFILTEKGREFLTLDPKPYTSAAATAEAAMPDES